MIRTCGWTTHLFKYSRVIVPRVATTTDNIAPPAMKQPRYPPTCRQGYDHHRHESAPTASSAAYIIGFHAAYAASTFSPFSIPHSFHGIAAQTQNYIRLTVIFRARTTRQFSRPKPKDVSSTPLMLRPASPLVQARAQLLLPHWRATSVIARLQDRFRHKPIVCRGPAGAGPSWPRVISSTAAGRCPVIRLA